jgi:hypothetical protein
MSTSKKKNIYIYIREQNPIKKYIIQLNLEKVVLINLALFDFTGQLLQPLVLPIHFKFASSQNLNILLIFFWSYGEELKR